MTPLELTKFIFTILSSLGEERNISIASPVAGTQHIYLYPQDSAGKPIPDVIWIVTNAMAYHDDNAAARQCYWNFRALSETGAMASRVLWSESVADNVYTHSLNAKFPSRPFFVCTGASYWDWQVNSLAAGKKTTLNASYYQLDKRVLL